MATLGQIVAYPDGSKEIMSASGLIPWTPALEQVAASGAIPAAINSMVRSLSLGLIDPGDREAEAAFSPIAAKAGLGLDIALIAGGGVLGAGKALAGRAARESIEGAIEAAAKGAQAAVPGAPRGLLDRIVGRTSSGFIPRASGRVPRALQPSVAGISAGVQAFPGLRVVGDIIEVSRQRNLAGIVGDSMRMPRSELKAGGGFLTPQTMAPKMAKFDQVYDQTRQLVTDTGSRAQLTPLVDSARGKGLITELEQTVMNATDGPLGDQMLDLRTALRQVSRGSESRAAKQEAQEIINQIQETIKNLAEGTDYFDELVATDIDYKMWKAVDSTIRGEGLINPTSLKRALAQENSLGTNVVMGGKREGLEPRVRALLEGLDEYEALGFRVPTSGTAERQSAALVLSALVGFPLLN